MSTPKAHAQPMSLKIASNAFLVFWLLLAIFPLFWILAMSFKIAGGRVLLARHWT